MEKTITLLVFLCLWQILSAEQSPLSSSNSNLELAHHHEQWPEGYRPGQGEEAIWMQEDGNHFIRLKCSVPGNSSTFTREIVIPKGVLALKLSWRERVTGLKPGRVEGGDARIKVEFVGAKKNHSPSGENRLYSRSDTDGWRERSGMFLVPEGTSALRLEIGLFQVLSGTFDVDDLAVQPADPVPIRNFLAQVASIRSGASTFMLGNRGSLISNQSFEVTNKNGNGPEDWGTLSPGVSGKVEEGNHFLRMRSSESDKMVAIYRSFNIPSGIKAMELSWRERVTGLKIGKMPWFDARIIVEFRDEDGIKMNQKPSAPYTTKDTKGWEKRSFKFLIPEDALSLSLMPALFQVSEGTFDIDDITLTATDPAPLYLENKESDKREKDRYVLPEEAKFEKWPKELHIQGNRLLNSDKKEVWLQGVNAGGLESVAQDTQMIKSAVVAVEDWKSNVVRLPVKGDFWFGRSLFQKDGGKEYREKVDQIITLVANRGSYVVLDLHHFRAPKKEDVEFWQDAAMRYKNHPAVLFDLFNEPFGITWEVWRDGGFVGEKHKRNDESAFLSEEEKRKNKGFQSVGMQGLLNTVRETGARNIVVVAGLTWSNDLTGITKGFALEDKSGNGIMYSWHVYNWHKNWAQLILPTAEKYPIFVGEVGADIHKMDFIPHSDQEDPYTWVPDMLGFIQKYKLNWTGWCLHPAATPILILDWNYTPSPFWGVPAKEALSGKQFEMKKMR
ncbi:MAG: cellulase family glycosylhydrolase [Verrucomicrobiota bacterium]